MPRPPELLIQTKLIPPAPRRHWLGRPRLHTLLLRMAETPLTLVVAGAGYSKSVTLAGFFADVRWPCAWYSLSAADADPARFLRHLIGALAQTQPGIGAAALDLLAADWSPALGQRAVDLLANELLARLREDTFLALDDAQHIDQGPVAALIERLLAHAPARLHVVIAARRTPGFGALAVWRARDLVREISQAELAFTSEEVAALFAAHGQPLNLDDAARLAARTEGWAMALQLIRQSLAKPADSADQLALDHDSRALHTLFEYLAAEVLSVQPPQVQRFLLSTAIVRTLDPTLCDQLLEQTDSAALLDRLHGAELFLQRVEPQQYRYHQLFQEFLQVEAQRRGIALEPLHLRAAAFLRRIGQDDEAIYHFLAAGDAISAAALLESIALPWIQSGRAAALRTWLDRLPPALLDRSALLLYAQGEVARLLSHYDAALDWYQRAERAWTAEHDRAGRSRALQGQAQVYLDTVRPAPAQQLLKRALKLLGRTQPAESAALLHLLAENTTNLGRAGLATKLHAAAERVWPAARTSLLQAARVELRTGKIVEARARLQAELEHVPPTADAQPPEAHREPLMLLALLACWMGEPEAARAYAERGVRRGRAISSPIVEAVGEIRLGHSLQLAGEDAAAAASYERAVRLASDFGVARTKAEPLMGQVLLAGSRGDMLGAELVARDALAIVQRTGDEWMAALLWLALGAAAVTNRRVGPALDALDQAERRFEMSGDSYGAAAVQLWRALALLRTERTDEAAATIQTLLLKVQAGGYDVLIVRPTLFTPRDRQMLAPLLLRGLAIPAVAGYARELLVHAFPALSPLYEPQPPASAYHPGVTLRIQTLGQFRVWRGIEEIRIWGREKARQLLQLLLTKRSAWLQRDQIIEYLWPDASPDAATSQFKVTLNALMTALEPNRPPHAPSFYIKRNGAAYRFLPPAESVQIDLETFEQLLDQADQACETRRRIELYQSALALYNGDYLSDSLYEDWLSSARERLLQRYLSSAHAVAELLLEHGQTAGAIRWGELVLARDACWEATYRLLMCAYVRQDNRLQAIRTYERCVRLLDAELGIAPLPETTRIIEALLKPAPVAGD
jgi:ATP/maltotriose-dependent transcriptional regulator MalT/DNA-binding SARP family transcriptional activator